MSELYVQYGCGWTAPEGWLNFDASPTIHYERLPVIGKLYTRNKKLGRYPPNVRHGDVVKGLPVASGTCRGVFASHVLEHLTLEDFETALGETFRMLAPGGIFRLIVPDLETAARRYIAELDAGSTTANSDFMRRTYLGRETRGSGAITRMRDAFGNFWHQWMWDYPSLHHCLEAHGFTDIRRAAFNDSEDPAFKAVEEPPRFESACAVEARRPR